MAELRYLFPPTKYDTFTNIKMRQTQSDMTPLRDPVVAPTTRASLTENICHKNLVSLGDHIHKPVSRQQILQIPPAAAAEGLSSPSVWPLVLQPRSFAQLRCTEHAHSPPTAAWLA